MLSLRGAHACPAGCCSTSILCQRRPTSCSGQLSGARSATSPRPHGRPPTITAQAAAPASTAVATSPSTATLRGLSHSTPSRPASVTSPLPAAPQFQELFTLGKEVGKGCFAVVYEVTEKATGRTLCAKKLPKTRARQTPQHTLAAIRQEVHILRQLQSCPDVLRLHSVVEDADHIYIITEACTGGTLAEHLKAAGPLPEAHCAHALRTVLSAIQACHAAGVEYGDLKPSNVLLRRPAVPGQPLALVLADFGCSQQVDGCGRASSSPGTPLFAAPEVVFKRNGLEADLWSAGVLLFHMLSGQWPFFAADESVSPNTVMRRALSGPILWGAPAWGHVSSGAVRLIERMLDREKSSRITAKEALRHPWLLENTAAAGAAEA